MYVLKFVIQETYINSFLYKLCYKIFLSINVKGLGSCKGSYRKLSQTEMFEQLIHIIVYKTTPIRQSKIKIFLTVTRITLNLKEKYTYF